MATGRIENALHFQCDFYFQTSRWTSLGISDNSGLGLGILPTAETLLAQLAVVILAVSGFGLNLIWARKPTAG